MAWNKHAAASFCTTNLQDLQEKLMRNVLLMCLLLTGCATQMVTPEKRTHDFYTFYLMSFVTDSKEDNLDSLKMRDYIAQDTLSRLQKISSLYEQEIIGSDYFTYTQD